MAGSISKLCTRSVMHGATAFLQTKVIGCFVSAISM